MNKTWTTRIALLLIPLVLGVFALAPALAAQPAAGANKSPLQDIPVQGTVVGGGGTFNGSLDIVSFEPNATNDGIVATGLLTGVLRTPGGNQPVENFLVTGIPVTLEGAGNAPTSHVCDILDLSIGPIDLDLLGLVVHVDEINITIDAERGPGNLLGNLLCAIAGLLDGNPLGDVLNQIVGLLNRIIDLLG
ncbi:MAG TPA: hypothetical protein VFR15_03390 [Chloroflexia bacterium]|nr:hypothetical protein [Chloroflexia bacterium]